MDNFILRIPLVAEEIFSNLDNQNLNKSREISRSWKTFLDNNKLLGTRIIQEYNISSQHKKSWEQVLSRMPAEIVREFVQAVKVFIKNGQHFNKKLKKNYPPHQVAASHGNIMLYKYVIA